MAIVTASTRSEFFRRYNGFELRPQASLYAEFVRLAKARQWKRGSNSKVYEKSWRLCFGDAVPVGRDIGYVDTEDDELIAKLQDLNISRGSKKKLKHKEVAPEFTAFYGSASNDLQVWQQMCRDCGIKDVPGKLSQCKAVRFLNHLFTRQTRLTKLPQGSQVLGHQHLSLH